MWCSLALAGKRQSRVKGYLSVCRGSGLAVGWGGGEKARSPTKLNEPEREGRPWVSPVLQAACLLFSFRLVGIDQLHAPHQICILEIFSPVCGFSQHSLKSGFQREKKF